MVANEVKELARQTASATEDIGRTVSVVQLDSRQAIDAIADISRTIGTMNEIQAAIAAAVEEQATATSEIGRNVSEAAQGSTDIAFNISQVAQAAKATSEGASQSGEAARELASLAGELSTTVARFQLGGPGRAVVSTAPRARLALPGLPPARARQPGVVLIDRTA